MNVDELVPKATLRKKKEKMLPKDDMTRIVGLKSDLSISLKSLRPLFHGF